jgi:hypothetical protein
LGAAAAQGQIVAPVPIGPSLVPIPVITPALPLEQRQLLQPMPLPQLLEPAQKPLPTAQEDPMSPKKKHKAIPKITPDSPDELVFAARSALELSVLAEAIGEERGRKVSRMTGKDFMNLLEEARERYAERQTDSAPSPRAFAAAQVVQEQIVRIVGLLVHPDEPLSVHVNRALGVWNVFNQELARVAQEKGTLDSIETEARLFARQVEDSPDR